MKSIDLTTAELFKQLSGMEIEPGIYIDLHNHYECHKITFNGPGSELSLNFHQIEPPAVLVSVIFRNAVVARLDLDFAEVCAGLTLDQFYRGRFQVEEKLHEYSADQKGYFYVDFLENVSIEHFSDDVKLVKG